ncbi:hypothetical protein VNO80_07858 [Phaseolus coccineus]|uniref:PGG domain-containing protein n=1 Tax=Phaseolus coccineus TaxID=3886 RepID=A0AAN9NPG8_PHACN
MVTIPGTGKNWLRYFQYEERRDTPSDTRNILLIIFTLVAAVTFQAAVNPPGGVWQETEDEKHAGRATYALDKKGYYVFLIFNTLAFANSVFIILSLTHKFPFHLEIWAATVSMSVSYGSAIFPSLLRTLSIYAMSLSLLRRPLFSEFWFLRSTCSSGNIL